MIDTRNLVYAGVIMLFLAGAFAVALTALVVLGAGFAAALTVRILKRRKSAAAVPGEGNR